MKQYSFLTESRNHLINSIHSRHSGRAFRQVRRNINSLIGKKLTPEEYSHKMIKGQLNRAQKLAQKHGVPLEIKWINNGDIRHHIDDKTGKHVLFLPSKVTSNTTHKMLNPLDRANVITHEVDELSRTLQLSKKYNTSPSNIQYATSKQTLSLPNNVPHDTHAPGVLPREVKRSNTLYTMYPDSFNPIYRQQIQIDNNKKPNKFFSNALNRIR
jgi:hypothetical protein